LTIVLFQTSCGDSITSSIIKDKKWESLPAAFKEVKLEKMDGKNLLSKVMSSKFQKKYLF
jgi:hypothetical protein